MLSTTLRYLLKNKLVSFINVLGLSIGITSCLVIFLLINYETSFDTFSPERDRVYRIYSSFSGTFTSLNYGVPTGFADKVRESFTGVDAVANTRSCINKDSRSGTFEPHLGNGL